MKIALIGSRWFGAQALKLLRERGHELFVVSLKAGDALVEAARSAEIAHVTLDGARRVEAEHLPGDFDLIVAAHSHAFISPAACRRARLAAIGYHPSLLPRHRGIAAVEWTIKLRDPIAGGSVYHLSESLDGGALAAQDWCFVYPEDDAASLWRRALAPMGLRLLMQVVAQVEERGHADAFEQDPKAVTYAPSERAAAH